MDYFFNFNLVGFKVITGLPILSGFESLDHTAHDRLPHIVHILWLIKLIFQENWTLPANPPMSDLNQELSEDIFYIPLFTS